MLNVQFYDMLDYFFLASFSFCLLVPFYLLYCLFQVPGELVISAHSGAHSFDASQMNMSHIVTHLSFGTMVSERLWTDMKRLLPYLGQSHDRLNGKSFINQRKFDVNVTVSSTNFM